MSPENTTPTALPLTIAGEARTVQVVRIDSERVRTAERIALARVGRTGTALWPVDITFWRHADGSWRPVLAMNIIRKPARVVAWNDPALADHVTTRA